MLGSIYIGLSGMNAYSKGLQTISNNVANLNTTGFKATTIGFNDLYVQGNSSLNYSGHLSGDKRGGGVRVGELLVDFSQGELRQSENDLDLAIQGDGFLVLRDGTDSYYMRTGQFTIGDQGYIVEQNSQYRLGLIDGAGTTKPASVDNKRTSAPVATTKIVFADNLSSSATQASVSDIAVYDSNGGMQVWTAAFVPSTASTGLGTEWTVTVTDANGRTLGTSTLRFIANSVDPATSKLVINDTPENADPLEVTLDFSSGVTSYSAGTTSSLRAQDVDGRPSGTLASVTVDEDGQLTLTYSNEETELLGSVAIADFDDLQSLEKVSGGLYKSSSRQEVRLGSSGQDGVGTLVSRQLEASNVDLSAEFGELILIQRGFQAASQVVSISNDMIQQLFGIRGQG